MSGRPPSALTAPARPYGPDFARLGLTWAPGDDASARTATTPDAVAGLLRALAEPLAVVEGRDGALRLAQGGVLESGSSGHPVRAWLPPMPPEALGDPTFAQAQGLRGNVIAGAMANGIASTDLVIAMGRAGMMGFFGAAGLSATEVDEALTTLARALPDEPWGSNLIHSPYEPELEQAIASLYARRGVRRVSASAYLRITPALVSYRLHGIHEENGRVVAPHQLFAKVSRVELAEKFLGPPPAAIVDALVRDGTLTEAQARLAGTIPLATAITAEADSGGHTDNRPLGVLLPALLALRDRAQPRFADRIAVGAAGGLGTPSAVAAAFALGADYVLTGSINQGCREAGTSDAVRALLAEVSSTDVTMAPAADMFEMGVELQVLRRGTMFAARARQLAELYRTYPSFEEIPAATRASVERQIFRAPYATIWAETQAFWRTRDPSRLAAAATDPKRQMALCFRWYLGRSSRWANAGDPDRAADYQIWCGPAMGAFNAWVRGSWLEDWAARDVATLNRNLLVGAALRTRIAMLRAQGIALDPAAIDDAPRPLAALEACSA